jgi:hypothetical protein
MMAEKIVAKYTSDSGEHFMGVPARDLYETDWNALTDEQKADVNEAPFYTVRGEKAAAVKAPEKAEPVAEMPKDEAKR